MILKTLADIALLAMLGQGVLWVLAGSGRERNPVYRLLKIVTSPVMKLARLVTPRIVVDRYIWIVALLLLCCVWVALVVAKAQLMHGAVPLA